MKYSEKKMDRRNNQLVASENFIYENVIMCKMDPFNTHILKQPKVLPCGNTACLECIEKNIDESKHLSCSFQIALKFIIYGIRMICR